MAKKVKKKGHHALGQTEKRSPLPVAPIRIDIAKKLVVDREKHGFAEKKLCKHVNKVIDLVNVSTRIRKFGRIHCQVCCNASKKRDKKGGSKQSRSKRSVQESGGSNCIYICLACGHLSCGQSDSLSKTNDAHRHWHFVHHPFAVQWDNLVSCWCFECNVFVVADVKETEECSVECGKGGGIVSDVRRLIEEHSMKDSETNV